MVPVTVSCSSCFLEVDYGWLNSGFRLIWCVSPDNFPKQTGQWWYWYIVKVRFEMRVICSLVSCNFLFLLDLFKILFLAFGSIVLLEFKLIYMYYCELACIYGWSTDHKNVLVHTISFMSLQKGNSWNRPEGNCKSNGIARSLYK